MKATYSFGICSVLAILLVRSAAFATEPGVIVGSGAETTPADDFDRGKCTVYMDLETPYGYSVVSQAWAAIEKDCDRLEEFKTIIINNLMNYELPSGANQFTICRYSGHVEGMLQGIEELYSTSCPVSCADQGALIGEISAITYCELSLAMEGLATADDFVRLPVQFCGKVFEIFCDLKYNAITRTYVNDLWDDPATLDVNEGECKRYTDLGDIIDPETGDSMWEPVWHQVRDIQCSYVPIPNPERRSQR
jgi:hypothetical protein